MLKKILVANRGEIACRIMRTAKKMGIATVAIYSEADQDARHVREADESYLIGPAPSSQSYLNIAAVIDVVKKSGADAVHPGYGFLSENAVFAETLAKEGVVFIGPPVASIAAMGDKIESKRLAKKVGVSTIPGHDDAIGDNATARKIADDIGYPVMIKASAGGGGKGMRVVHRSEDIDEAYRAARSEAKSSFGDDRVLIEKFIENPRHIEIQILADQHGNCLYLGERECSIQRRHQKVIEESPSPLLDDATRQRMGAQAVALAKAVGYQSAGTVEFVADQSKNFYFLEMNTRLQVEHPITEMVTGIDLVEWMIRIAAGEKLAFSQADIALAGHAMELRIYAEDPSRQFLPSIGRLSAYREPPEALAEPGYRLRIDSGAFDGGEVSIHYDPMIAKLIAHGPDRAQTIQLLRRALDEYYIEGPVTNIPFLASVLKQPQFLSGAISTHFIAQHYRDGYDPRQVSPDAIMAVTAAILHILVGEFSRNLQTPKPSEYAQLVVVLNNEKIPVEIWGRQGAFSIDMQGRRYAVNTSWKPGMKLFHGRLEEMPFAVQVARDGLNYRLYHDGSVADCQVFTADVAELLQYMPAKRQHDLSKYLLSPMPGLLLSVSVQEGQDVKAGQELAVIEAMKMENLLRADRDGQVVKIHARPGDSLSVDQPILEFAFAEK